MKISSQLAQPLEPRINAGYNKRMGWDKAIRNSRGQVAVLFALVFTFMFVLFAFVIDFGHLIHNKMNLQIAADAAAYAGAAWQARLLNQMGAVNYHMRQDYKEMVVRFQVTHTRHNLEFPRGKQFLNAPFDQLTTHSQLVCQQAHSYRALRGRQYAKDTNLCLNADPRTGGLPPIIVPPLIASFDAFSVALRAQILAIQRQADIECDQGREDNERLVDHLVTVFGSRANFHANQMRTIRNFINEAATGNITTSNHPILAAARESALRNLTDSNRNGDFKIEILPPQENKYLELKPMQARNTALWFDFQSRGSACVAIPGQKQFQVLEGFEKDPEYLTYFGVKVTSRPRMLFMPQAWVETAFPVLQAYSLAKPFGSRIGPQAETDLLVGVPRNQAQSFLINFGVKPGDRTGIRSAKLLAFYDSLHKFNDIGAPEGNQGRGWPNPGGGDPNLTLPLQAVRTPTIFDAVFYTIFPDPGGTLSQEYEEPEYAQALYPDYLEAAGPNNALIPTRTPASPAYFNSFSGRNGQPGYIRIDAPFDVTGSAFGNYASEEPATHSTTSANTLFNLIQMPGREAEFGFATKETYHSAWTPPGEKGRIGYGVKFLSINTLQRLKNTSSSGDTIEIRNKPRPEPNFQEILH